MKLKLIAILFIASIFSISLKAQDEKEEKDKGFKKENLFTGGTVTASFYNGVTVLGISPLFGYKIANWTDAGLVFNLTYTGVRDYQQFDDKLKRQISEANRRLPDFKRVGGYLIWEKDFPRTASMKIKRPVLAEDIAGALTREAIAPL